LLLFRNCHLRRPDSILFLSFQAHVPAGCCLHNIIYREPITAVKFGFLTANTYKVKTEIALVEATTRFCHVGQKDSDIRDRVQVPDVVEEKKETSKTGKLI
jgi:hypothetical protein